jgi:hypothetical protein
MSIPVKSVVNVVNMFNVVNVSLFITLTTLNMATIPIYTQINHIT